MDVRPTPDQEEFIRQAIEAGRFGRAEDTVAAWTDYEHTALPVTGAEADAFLPATAGRRAAHAKFARRLRQ